MKKIQIFAKELGYNSFSKELIVLANSLSNLYSVELVFFNNSESTPYTLNKKIKTRYINNIIIFILNNKIESAILETNADILISTDLVFNFIVSKFENKNLIYWHHRFNENSVTLKKLLSSTKKFNKVVFASTKLFNSFTSPKKVYIPDGLSLKNCKSDLKTKNLIFIGKLTKDKHLDDLLEIMNIVREKDREITLNIIGDGPEKNNLVNLAKNLRLGLSVSFLGSLSEDEKQDVLIDSAIYVTTSVSDSFGLSYLEAMSYGIPVIAFNESLTNAEIIQNEINGYIINNRDKHEFANKILYLINHFTNLGEMGSCSYETSLVYDINNIKSEWIKILK